MEEYEKYVAKIMRRRAAILEKEKFPIPVLPAEGVSHLKNQLKTKASIKIILIKLNFFR